MAHIDTGSNHIRVPAEEFNSLLSAMQQADPTITPYEEEKWEGNIMKSRKSCSDLAPLLKDLKITLNKAVVVMKPRAYLYAFMDERDCLIAIESSPPELDEYRLGTLFLRHLYLGLDYKHNAIVLGQNPHAQDIYFEGKAPNPYRTAPSAVVVFAVFFLIGLIILGVFCYVRAKKIDEQQRTVVFGKQVLSSESTVRRYKDGVEIKPSEYSKADQKKVAASAAKKMAINESRDESDEEVPVAEPLDK